MNAYVEYDNLVSLAHILCAISNAMLTIVLLGHFHYAFVMIGMLRRGSLLK